MRFCFLGLATLLVVLSSISGTWSSDPVTSREKPLEQRVTNRTGKLLLKRTTVMKTAVVTSTKAVLTTCYSTTAGAQPCNGRRRKRDMEYSPSDLTATIETSELDSTFADSPAQTTEIRRQPKVITFWSSSITTLTFITKSFIAGTTATVTVACTLPIVFTAPSCGFLHFD